MRKRTRQPLSSTRLGIPRGGRIAAPPLVLAVRRTGPTSDGIRRGVRDGCDPGLSSEGRDGHARLQERPGRRGMASASVDQSVPRPSSVRASTSPSGEGGDEFQGSVFSGIGSAPRGSRGSRGPTASIGLGSCRSSPAEIRARVDIEADRSGTGDRCRRRRWADSSGLVGLERSD